MLNVTYVWSTYANIADTDFEYVETYPLTSRVMDNILKNQKGLNVTYSKIPQWVTLAYFDYCKKYGEVDRKAFHKEFCENVIETIDTDIVLLTLGNPFEVLFLSFLINCGKKVVVGGPYVKHYDLETLRELFKVNGVDNLENVLIVRPYINKDIDLEKIINEWKDIDKDVKFDTSNLILSDSDHDFYQDYIPSFAAKGIDFKRVPMMFQSQCAWGKCSFCKYTTDHNHKFVTEDNVEAVANYMMRIADRYRTKHISVHDPEFYFNSVTKKFLEVVGKHGYMVSFFTSVRLLKNDTYWENIKKYSYVIRGLIIGWETFDEYSLKAINKGVTSLDAWEVIYKIIEFNERGENSLGLANLFMTDLVSPNKESIIRNYDLCYKFKKLLEKSKSYFAFSFSKFNINPLTEYNKTPLIRIRHNELSVLNDYYRVDENGNVLPEDKDIVDPKIYNYLIPDIRWGV